MVIAMSLLLTGCVKANVHVTVNEDGSADLSYKMTVDSELIEMMAAEGMPIPMDFIKGEVEDDGFEVSVIHEGNYQGIEAKKHLETFEDLASEMDRELDGTGTDDQMKMTREDGFFYDTYRVKGKFDLTKFVPIDELVGFEQMDMKFTLTLPVEAEAQNSTRTLADGVTYQWDLEPGKVNEVDLQAKVMNTGNVALVGGLVVLLLVVAVVFFVIMRKKKQYAQL